MEEQNNNDNLNKKPCYNGLINNLNYDSNGYKIIKICDSSTSSQKCKECDCYFELYRTKLIYILYGINISYYIV